MTARKHLTARVKQKASECQHPQPQALGTGQELLFKRVGSEYENCSHTELTDMLHNCVFSIIYYYYHYSLELGAETLGKQAEKILRSLA